MQKWPRYIQAIWNIPRQKFESPAINNVLSSPYFWLSMSSHTHIRTKFLFWCFTFSIIPHQHFPNSKNTKIIIDELPPFPHHNLVIFQDLGFFTSQQQIRTRWNKMFLSLDIRVRNWNCFINIRLCCIICCLETTNHPPRFRCMGLQDHNEILRAICLDRILENFCQCLFINWK